MYVTPKEASKYYNVSEQALRSWAITGKIKYFTMQPSPLRQSLQLVWMSPYPLLPIHMLDDAHVAV